LAALLGFEAWGIEVERGLVHRARRLAADFDLPVEFACGSFIPPQAEAGLLGEGEFGWLNTGGASAYESMGLDLGDFDLVFAYPWPDEEGLVADLFEQHARAGALLLTYHACEDICLRQKLNRGRAR